jgi:hypothetical protein
MVLALIEIKNIKITNITAHNRFAAHDACAKLRLARIAGRLRTIPNLTKANAQFGISASTSW